MQTKLRAVPNINRRVSTVQSGLGPQPLRPDSNVRLLGLAVSLVLCLLPISFIVLAILAKRLDGEVSPSISGENVKRWTMLAPSIFPIVFAAIVAQSMRNVARYNLERGWMLKYIEQFTGSQSLSGMISTQARLGLVDLTGIALILMWLISPLGGQASLRLLSTRTTVAESTGQIGFANLSATDATTFSAFRDGSTYQTTMNGLYTTSLLSSLSVKNSPQDIWGNVKIPTFESLPPSADESGYKSIPDGVDDTDWASLIGLPVTGLKQGTTLTSNISASYYYVNCSSMQGLNGRSDWPAKLGAPKSINNTNFWGPSQYQLLFFNNTPQRQSLAGPSLGMLFIAWSGEIITANGFAFPSNVTVGNCTIAPSFIDVQVACKDLSCRAAGARRSSSERPPSNTNTEKTLWGSLLDQDSGEQRNFLDFWSTADNATSAGMISPTLNYLGGAEAFPFVSPATSAFQFGQAAARLYELDLNDVSRRLRTLLNTYWQSSLGTLSYNGTIARDSPALMTPSEADVVQPTLVMNLSDATVRHETTVYECDTRWFAITLIASGFLLIVGVVGFAARCACVGPDLLGSFTTVLRMNSETARLLNGNSSTLDSGAIAKANRDLVVALQDTKPEQDVGLVGVGVVGDGVHRARTIGDARRQDEGRFYE